MDGYKSVLAGTDLSAASNAAVEQAVRIGRWSDSPPRVAHVIDKGVIAEYERAAGPSDAPVVRTLTEHAHHVWSDLARTLDGAGDLALHVLIDDRAAGIVRGVVSMHADLLTLGVAGGRALDVGVGTVATACVRHSPSDVLLVRETARGPFRTILACTDFSDTSRLAIDRAAYIAQRDGAALHVLHVYTAPTRLYPLLSEVVKAWFDAALDFESFARGRLETAVAGSLARSPSVKPVLHVTEALGHGRAIASLAAQIGADLIVLGTRGRSSLHDMLLGSTAERVLRDSACSILAVRPRGSGAAVG